MTMTRGRRVPRTFEAAFSQARAQPNHPTVNYQQALSSSHHPLIALLPPPVAATTTATATATAIPHPLDQIILGEQLDLPLHDPATHFLTSLVHPHHPVHPPSDLIFHSPEQQQSYSPDPPPSNHNNHNARLSSPDDLYGSSPPNTGPHESPQPSSPPPQPPTITPAVPAPPPTAVPAPPPKKIVLALPRPPPLKLCLPPHARREVTQDPPHPPCNSPADTPAATSSVPAGGSSTSGLRPAGRGKQPLSRPAKRIPSSSSSAAAAAAAAKKQKHNPLFLASASAKHKLISEADRLRVLKRIQVLKGPRNPSSSSSSTNTESQTGPNTPLARATQLATDAQAYLDAIQKVQDALGEELVRVQLEESVLRHVRGIIADRLVKNHDWNHHNHHA